MNNLDLAALTLGIPPTAGPAAIQAAFRRRVLACHPDRAGDRQAFQDLIAARDVLLAAAPAAPTVRVFSNFRINPAAFTVSTSGGN